MSDGMTDNRSQPDEADEQSGDECTLAECPPGLFLCNGELGFKSEYHTKPYQPDAYCVASGEYFWGGVSGATELDKLRARGALKVLPIDIDDLKARPEPALQTAVDPVRLEALRLAVQTFPEPGDHASIDGHIVRRAGAFLAFLDPASVAPCVPESVRTDADGEAPKTEAESLMDRLERHAKVIQRALPRVSVSTSEALHIADAIRLDDARRVGEQPMSAPSVAPEPEIPAWQAAEVGDFVEFDDGARARVADIDENSISGHRLGLKGVGWAHNSRIKRIVRKAGEVVA